MSRRWKALPRDTRWLAGAVAAGVLALVVAWVLLVPAPDWLAHHDVGSAGPATLQTARDAARGRLLTLGAGLLAGGALLFTAWNFLLSREGQVTDRYTRAIEQLGSDKLDVRIGGIYALERIARDSATDHPTVMAVLAAFIREHSREPWPVPEPGTVPGRKVPFPRPDVQAALTVIGRRDARRDREAIDLTAAVLPRALLFDANLTRVRLVGADLTRADLTSASIARAKLDGARLDGVRLDGVRLDGVRWPEGAAVPAGWILDPGTGRLGRASAGSGPAGTN